MSDVVRWFDHRGEIVEAERPANGARVTAYRRDDQRNHWLFGDPAAYSVTPVMQALTLCGRRAHEVPGRGEVDCPECDLTPEVGRHTSDVVTPGDRK